MADSTNRYSNGIQGFPIFLRGIVKSHLTHGRLKVFIPGVYPDEFENRPDMLPECELTAPLFGGTNNGNGMFSYPDINSVVWCFFQNGDQNFPVAFAATLGGPMPAYQYDTICRNETTEEEMDENGEIKKLEDEYSNVHHISIGQSHIKIWEADHGRIELIVKSDDAEIDSCRIQMDGKGNMRLFASKQIEIESENIKITAGSKMEIQTPSFTNINTTQNSVVAPSIQLDARTGVNPSGKVLISGKTNGQLFY